jgi:hypothetical protein
MKCQLNLSHDWPRDRTLDPDATHLLVRHGSDVIHKPARQRRIMVCEGCFKEVMMRGLYRPASEEEISLWSIELVQES